ncbi:MAG: prepilin-type N-terminal cleavage/methylation domain-containing protein [Gallionella sp.]|jgi:prepilin-type N-terminal cleavage/methylation domain-containing protein
MMWTQNKSPQSGFTLIELAIVLVIIGLILGAVLKGQEMINNARAKSVVNDLRGISAAYYSYYDRYKAIPGDDNTPANHLGQAAFAGNGNGVITGAYTDTAAIIATESQAFWQHTRMSGFLTGSILAATTFPSTNAMGGLLGVEGGTANVYGMIGNVVCAGSIPWRIAQAVDILLDDGNSDAGTVRTGATGAANLATAAAASVVYGTSVAGVAAAAPASVDQLHTLCMRM